MKHDLMQRACDLYCDWYDHGRPEMDGAEMAYELVSLCRQELARQKAAVTLEHIPPIVTPRGSLCMLCDSMAGCSHPQRRCKLCGAEGLAENFDDHRC